MAGRTNSDRIEDLSRQVIILTRDLEHLSADFRAWAEFLSNNVMDLGGKCESANRSIDLLEQRFTHLEEQNPAQIPSSRNVWHNSRSSLKIIESASGMFGLQYLEQCTPPSLQSSSRS